MFNVVNFQIVKMLPILMDPWAEVMFVFVEVFFILQTCVDRICEDLLMGISLSVVDFILFDLKVFFSFVLVLSLLS